MKRVVLGALVGVVATLYFTAAGGSSGEGKVARIPKEGGPVEDLATGVAQPFAVAVDATGVYFTCVGDGSVRKLPRR